MVSDYGKWFVTTDGTDKAIKCNRETLIDCLKDLVGPERASKIFSTFRRASFSEHCKLELALMED